QDRPETFARGGKVEAADNGRPKTKPETHAAAPMQVRRLEQAVERHDLPGIGEHRHVQQTERVPAMLEADGQRVAVTEPVVPKSAQSVTAAERRLEVKGDCAAAFRKREDDRRAQGDHASAIEVRQVLLRFEFCAAERKCLEINVPVLAISAPVESAAAWARL